MVLRPIRLALVTVREFVEPLHAVLDEKRVTVEPASYCWWAPRSGAVPAGCALSVKLSR
jgi:hypothetical protein